MKKIFLKDNYIVIETENVLTPIQPFSQKSVFTETSNSFIIKRKGFLDNFGIGFSEVGDYYNEAGDTAYTIETLRNFLSLNTGK